MLKKILIASMFVGTAAIGSVSPATAADGPADSHQHLIGNCSPGLLFDTSLLSCDYAGLTNPNSPA
ncbi:carbohydrate-binding module family 14 protein [Streptomyces sp. NPDC026589]|uniref:carbohydrate-binding module family 14 protein n=1 Tax=Streptomyces sp. NPDC026589 TaxID=3155609 RepID=UPI0033FA8E81